MLPVAHHACTLATGALRSSCTIKVSPSRRAHFFAELGGNVITDETSLAATFKLAVFNMRVAQKAARHAKPIIRASAPANRAWPAAAARPARTVSRTAAGKHT